MLGPSHETPAEVRSGPDRSGRGGDVNRSRSDSRAARRGQSSGTLLHYNLAAGKSKKVLSHDDVKDVANRVKDRMQYLVKELVKAI